MKSNIILLLCGFFLFVSCTPKNNGDTGDKTKPDSAVKGNVEAGTANIDQGQLEANKDRRQIISDRMDLLIDHVLSDAYNDIHEFIVYRGEDKERKWKDFYRMDDAKEKLEVEKMIAKLQVIFEGVIDYKVVGFKKETESEGEWNVLTMSIKGAHDKTEIRSFAFLFIRELWALGDID